MYIHGNFSDIEGAPFKHQINESRNTRSRIPTGPVGINVLNEGCGLSVTRHSELASIDKVSSTVSVAALD